MNSGPDQPASGSAPSVRPDLMVWPESPAPFYTTDPMFREAVSNIAREAQTWMLVGSLGIRNAGETPERATELYNSEVWSAPPASGSGDMTRCTWSRSVSTCLSSVCLGSPAA